MHAITPTCKRPKARNGFTLIELLIVIAIMALLAALTLPAMTSIGGGRDVAKAVDIAQSLASAGREQALARGALVYLLMSPTNAPGVISAGTNAQSLLLLQETLTTTTNSTVVTNWTAGSPMVRVPQDVLVYAAASGTTGSASSFFTNNITTNGNAFNPPTNWAKHSLVGYSYIAFYPDGSVSTPTGNSPYIYLQRTGRNSSLGSAPDYAVVIQQNSGRAKVISNPGVFQSSP